MAPITRCSSTSRRCRRSASCVSADCVASQARRASVARIQTSLVSMDGIDVPSEDVLAGRDLKMREQCAKNCTSDDLVSI